MAIISRTGHTGAEKKYKIFYKKKSAVDNIKIMTKETTKTKSPLDLICCTTNS